MLKIHSFTFNTLAENTYVAYDATKACAIVDPGCYTQPEQIALSMFIEQQGLQVTHLINTHAHIDHVLGNQYVKATYQVKLALHQEEIPWLQMTPLYAPIYGFPDYQPAEADIILKTGDRIQLGNTLLKVLHVPGHAPGHIALYSQQDRCCLVGDVLFQGSIGTTDIPCGDHAKLLQSIHQQLLPLGDEVVIYPGHGPTTTIGIEKNHNPFCKL